MGRRVAPPSKRRVIASAILVGLLSGGLAGYTIGLFTLPLEATCERDPKMKVMGRCDGGICEFSVEKCDDQTMRLRPMGFVPLRDEPVEDEGPKSEI